jgi:hypothetical protein
MEVIMRLSVFVPVILVLGGFGNVRGQSPKDEKPKDIKEIAVARVLGEPDRLMTQRAKAQKDKVAVLEKQLADIKNGIIPIPRFPLDPVYGFCPITWRVGDAGLVTCSVLVRQIIDENLMLVECNNLFLIKAATKGLVDGKNFYVGGFWVVSGTMQYKTAIGGTNTVFVLEQVDLEWLKAEAKKRMAPSTISKITETIEKEKAERQKAEADKKAADADRKAATEKAKADRIAAEEKAKWRTWTDSTGQYKTEAEYGGVAGGKVKLIKKDGSTVRLPLEQLSTEDQQWIKNKHR